MNQADLNEFENREANIKAKSKFLPHLWISLFTLLIAFGLFQSEFFSLRGLLIDLLIRTQPFSKPHPAITLVSYDEAVSAKYSSNKTIPATILANTILEINRYHPLAIAIISPVNEKFYTDSDLSQLSQAFSQVSALFIGYTDSDSFGKNAPRQLFHSAHYLPGFVSRDTFSYGADSVSRRVMLSLEGIPTVYSKLASLYAQSTDPNKNYPLDRIEKFGDASQTYIRWKGPAGTYPLISMNEISKDADLSEKFQGKIVLLGTTLKQNKDVDYIFTPYSREPFRTTMLEGAAQSLATLLDKDGLFRTPIWFDVLFTILISVISVNILLASSPAMGLVFLGGEFVFILAVAWIALFYFQCWINIAHPLITVFITYYFVIPYRLVEEYKKRWHYQEKSEFMAELEQLKTNFLSLVSHDLKTPLAQIQGNAELALNDPSTPLTQPQKKSINTILETTESLTNYVESILDLTRIEGSRVHLNKSSKDINTVIKDVVTAKFSQAQAKSIEIEMALEPLFAFKFDVKLIQQVLSNLLENAIKYSPSNSKISLVSKEEKSLVTISIIDQGYGIPVEEQEKIFTKFYRTSEPNCQKEKGTGLGLYLVKYFVELHKGLVTLSSQLGKGSNFTIKLPTQ